MTLDEAKAALETRVTSKPPLGGIVKFDLGSEGAIVINGQGAANVVTSGDTAADCTISMSLADLVELFHGRLQAMTAFMQGRMKVDGDTGLAMKLSQLV